MDDDVQYIGTRLPLTEPLVDTPVGITLHVEKCGDKPAHALSFLRARSSHVNIGRKSASNDKSMRRENDDHNAVFACQVVSAKHAKLVLSDSGQVYIVDLHSRHGTHILRRGEPAPRTLQAEVETPLADGDVLTFGKMVGAGSYHVSPVTARVELLRGRSPSVSSVRELSPYIGSPSSVLSRSRKLSSGRYGLISSSCIESDSVHSSSSVSMSDDAASSSQSDQDSDVEEEHPCTPTILREVQGKTTVKIPAFRSFIQDIYHGGALHSPAVSDAPLGDTPGSPSSAGAVRHPSPAVVIEPTSKPRCDSPASMDVPTPWPSPPPVEVELSEPPIIGAWPTSKPESPRRSSLEMVTNRPEVLSAPEMDREPEPQLPAPPTPSPPRVTTVPNDALIELMHRLPPPPPFFPIVTSPFSTSIASDFGIPSVTHPPPPPPPPPHRIPPFHPIHKVVTERVSSEVKGSLKSVEDRITVLQDTVNSLRSRQNVTEDDMADLQNQVEMLEPDSEHLLCRITGAERNIASLSMLQGQMTTLRTEVTAVRQKLDAPEPTQPVESPLQDIRACAEALNSLVSEMKQLRQDVEKRIEEKMDVIQSARSEALDALKSITVEAESVKSLKRKREETEQTGEEGMPPSVVNDVPASEVAPGIPTPAVSDYLPCPSISGSSLSEASTAVPRRPRPTKRARTALYTVAHTAAAIAVGAAATWSALAFS